MGILIRKAQPDRQPLVDRIPAHYPLLYDLIQQTVGQNPLMAEFSICQRTFCLSAASDYPYICVTFRITAAYIQVFSRIEILFSMHIFCRPQYRYSAAVGADRRLDLFLVLYSSSVYRPSPRSVCYTVWRYCGLVSFSYHLMVTERLQPQSLCIVVNQLDTA